MKTCCASVVMALAITTPTYFEIRAVFSKFKIEARDLGSHRSHSGLHNSSPPAASFKLLSLSNNKIVAFRILEVKRQNTVYFGNLASTDQFIMQSIEIFREKNQ